MSISNSIRLTLNLKDKNIKFKENFVEEVNIKGVDTLVYSGTLSPDAPSFCPKCGCINKNYDIIKHGSKTVNIKMPRVSNRKVILRLKKQRYYCKQCQKTFLAQSNCVDFNHSISRNTYHSCILQMKEKSQLPLLLVIMISLILWLITTSKTCLRSLLWINTTCLNIYPSMNLNPLSLVHLKCPLSLLRRSIIK